MRKIFGFGRLLSLSDNINSPSCKKRPSDGKHEAGQMRRYITRNRKNDIKIEIISERSHISFVCRGSKNLKKF